MAFVSGIFPFRHFFITCGIATALVAVMMATPIFELGRDCVAIVLLVSEK